MDHMEWFKEIGNLIETNKALLAACKAALEEHGKSVLISARTLALMEAAIAKAEGK